MAAAAAARNYERRLTSGDVAAARAALSDFYDL